MYNNNKACERCVEERGSGEYENCVYNNKDCHNLINKFSKKTCETCGCVFDDEIEGHYDFDEDKYVEPTKRECPLCKLRDEIPEMLSDLEDQIKERGIYSPDY